MAKILNMKDKIMQQILAGLLFKKTVIWTDLKINPGASRDNDVIYCSEKVVQVRERIDNYQATLNYVPGRHKYEVIDPEEEGVYTKIEAHGMDDDEGKST